MHILFLNPLQIYRRWPVPIDITRFSFKPPPITFPQLAACLSPNHTLEFIDGTVESLSKNTFAEKIKKCNAVAISTHHGGAALNTEINIRLIRRLRPDVTIIMGGLQASLFDREWLNRGVDFVVRAEGEITFKDLVEAIDSRKPVKEIKGLSYKEGDSVVVNPDRPFIKNLDTLPMPRWDLLNFHNYGTDNRSGFTCTIETSRGCAFHCNFCIVQHVWKQQQRHKSAGKVIDELFALKNLNVKKFWVGDENFGYHYNNDIALMNGMIERKLNMEWYCFSRADHIVKYPDFYKKGAQAGLKCSIVGFETMSAKNNENFYDKRYEIPLGLTEFKEVYRILKTNKIFCVGLFIIGHPNETKDEMYHTMKRYKQVCDFPLISLLRPEKGTPAYSLFKEEREEDLFYYDAQIKFSGFERLKGIWRLITIITFLRPLFMFFVWTPFERTFFLSLYGMLFKGICSLNRHNLLDFFYFVFKYPGGIGYDTYKEKIVKRYLAQV